MPRALEVIHGKRLQGGCPICLEVVQNPGYVRRGLEAIDGGRSMGVRTAKLQVSAEEDVHMGTVSSKHFS